MACDSLWLRRTDLDARRWVESLRCWLNLTVTLRSSGRSLSLIVATLLLTARRAVAVLIRGVVVLLRRRRLLLLLVLALL